MTASPKAPRNPFRKRETEETSAVLTTLQIAYVIAVGALMIAVSAAAASLLPEVRSTPGSSSSSSLPTQQQPQQQLLLQVPRKGGGVRSQARMVAVAASAAIAAPPAKLTTTSDAEAQTGGGSGGDDTPYHVHDDEGEALIHEEELVHMQQADPAGANLKLIDEQKAQVKEEIRQEGQQLYGHAAFGETEESNVGDSEDEEGNGRDSGNYDVHVVRRKGEASLTEKVKPPLGDDEDSKGTAGELERQNVKQEVVQPRIVAVEANERVAADERGGPRKRLRRPIAVTADE